MRVYAINVLGESILKIKGKANLAIEIFDFLRDSAKIFEIFDQHTRTYENLRDEDPRKVNFFLSYMNMAKRYSRKELALEKAQIAYHHALKCR